LTGCGVGEFTPNAVYRPVTSAAKPFGAYGLGVLPVEDQRPAPATDSNGGGGPIFACILLGGIVPFISAHVENWESGGSQVLNTYNPDMQRRQRGGGAPFARKAMAYQSYQGGGASLEPLAFIRQDLVKEFSHTRLLGPVQTVESPGATPFTLKASLKSSRVSARTYCYTPMDTTWIWWFLGLPFTTYTFDLKLDLELIGPDGTESLWTHSIDTEAKGTTDFYYATGPTGENNLEQIYDDLLAEAMSKASAELQSALADKKEDFWSRIGAGRPAAAPEARGHRPEAAVETKPAAAAGEKPWWQQDADKAGAKTDPAAPSKPSGADNGLAP
jgi:hypothetical protein